jgi:GNAT superfamily N-acetyltransferase
VPQVDLALARRLERAEAAAGAAFVESRATLDPDRGATWIEVAGAYAMFDGPQSPITQTFGIGLFEPFLQSQFDTVEEFFQSRGAPVFHEVCTLASPSTRDLLSSRGYTQIEESVVLVRPTADARETGGPISVRRIDEAEAPVWARTVAEGWRTEAPDLVAFLEEIGLVSARARGVACFLAELDVQPIAAAALNLATGVALLAGASTVPRARKQGAQNALLQARLAFAAARGIDLAMVVTTPEGASRRNAERQGFQMVYARTKWRLSA